MNDATPTIHRWKEAWLDGLAFITGLSLAWWLKWSTTDLVWSLWLSSLVVGYTLIVWKVSEPLRDLLQGIRSDAAPIHPGAKVGAVVIFGVGTVFGLAFFTVHFGGFHYGHSIFLSSFFPLDPGTKAWPGWPMYREVFVRYWWFLPAAFLAERGAFAQMKADVKPDVSVTAEAIAKRKTKGDAMMEPYKNVIRMHLLIFFFFAAHLLKLENFLVYAVVYAVYFFPWRLLRKAPTPAVATT